MALIDIKAKSEFKHFKQILWKCGKVKIFGNDTNKSRDHIGNRLSSRDSFCLSVRNILSSHLLCKNPDAKMKYINL
jgi:predicted ribosome quality control (RQC) complex YloA/Tae2 family protein